MIISGLAFIFMCMLKETYAPALLQKKAKLRRKEQDDNRYWSRYDNKIKFWPLLKVNLSRPFVMVFSEPVSTLSEKSLPFPPAFESQDMLREQKAKIFNLSLLRHVS